MKPITLITAKDGLSFELVPKPVHYAHLGPQIVVIDGDFRVASYCLSTFRESVAKKQGGCITAGKFEKYRAIESDTLAELVAEADALLSGTPPPPTSQGAPTPGPWQANPIGDTGRCSISAPHPSGGGQNVIDECLKENARLIAAAPELLAALESIAAGSVQDTGENGMGTVNIDRETMQLIARAAIAKAKGGISK